MALTITSPTTANISSELSTSFPVTVTNFVYYGSEDDYLEIYLKINGTIVGTVSDFDLSDITSPGQTKTLTFNLNSIKSAIYAAATGKSLTGCVEIQAKNGDITNPTLFTTTSKTGGTLTIAGRLSSLVNSTVNPYDLDNPTNIITSWTRPHSAFYGRITVYVKGVYCWSRYGFTTGTNFNPNSFSGYIQNMINAMGGSSPQELKIVIQSQFLANTYVDLSGGLLTATVTNGVIKSFIETSILTQGNFTIGDNIPFAITEMTSGVTYALKYEIGGVTVINRTTGITKDTTFITPTAGEITAMYNATGNITTDTTTIVATLTTIYDGIDQGTSVKNATLTIGTGAGTYPTFSGITNSENNAIVTAAAIGKYVQGLSKLNLAFAGAAAGSGATITEYKITVQNQTPILATSGTSATLQESGTIAIVGRITDSRNRYYEATINIDVLAYAVPKITSFTFKRSNGTVEDPLGNYAMFTFEIEVSPLINVTQKNTIQYRISSRTGEDPYAVEYQSVATNSVYTITATQHYSGYSELSPWDAKFEVIDKFYTTIQFASISTGLVNQSWAEEGMGIGKIKNEDAMVDIAENANQNSISADGNITTKRDLIVAATKFIRAGAAKIRSGLNNLIISANADSIYLRPNGDTSTTNQVVVPVSGSMTRNGNTVWDAGNDGSGSGLDSDLLEGQHGSFYQDIVDSGSGTNHWWVKLKDGTLIKGGTVTFTGTVSTAWGQLFTNASAQTLTYNTSVPFVGNPNVTFTPKSSPNNYLVWVSPYIGTTTNTQYWIISAISRVSQTYTIEWTAIGRWQ